jgi:hypothetical protein
MLKTGRDWQAAGGKKKNGRDSGRGADGPLAKTIRTALNITDLCKTLRVCIMGQSAGAKLMTLHEHSGRFWV